MAKQAETMSETRGEEQGEGEKFLAENGKKGVKTPRADSSTRRSTPGKGKSPKTSRHGRDDHYRGTLIDGTEFDSSYKRGQPATFQGFGHVPSWTEALQLMKEGAKWQLFVPSIAYGEKGAGREIGPERHAGIFEVEARSRP